MDIENGFFLRFFFSLHFCLLFCGIFFLHRFCLFSIEVNLRALQYINFVPKSNGFNTFDSDNFARFLRDLGQTNFNGSSF